MVAVAEQAGVSRRLVHDHFADLPSLFQAFFVDRVGSYLETFDEMFVAAAATPAERSRARSSLLDIPPADLRIIRMLTSTVACPRSPTPGTSWRRRAIDRWSAYLPDDLSSEVAAGVLFSTACQ